MWGWVVFSCYNTDGISYQQNSNEDILSYNSYHYPKFWSIVFYYIEKVRKILCSRRKPLLCTLNLGEKTDLHDKVTVKGWWWFLVFMINLCPGHDQKLCSRTWFSSKFMIKKTILGTAMSSYCAKISAVLGFGSPSRRTEGRGEVFWGSAAQCHDLRIQTPEESGVSLCLEDLLAYIHHQGEWGGLAHVMMWGTW